MQKLTRGKDPVDSLVRRDRCRGFSLSFASVPFVWGNAEPEKRASPAAATSGTSRRFIMISSLDDESTRRPIRSVWQPPHRRPSRRRSSLVGRGRGSRSRAPARWRSWRTTRCCCRYREKEVGRRYPVNTWGILRLIIIEFLSSARSRWPPGRILPVSPPGSPAHSMNCSTRISGS